MFDTPCVSTPLKSVETNTSEPISDSISDTPQLIKISLTTFLKE